MYVACWRRCELDRTWKLLLCPVRSFVIDALRQVVEGDGSFYLSTDNVVGCDQPESLLYGATSATITGLCAVRCSARVIMCISCWRGEVFPVLGDGQDF